MALIVDSINYVNTASAAPDKLRAEIGRYLSSNLTLNSNPFRNGIKTDFIIHDSQESTQLIPTRKAKIFVSGQDNLFRDQIQWNDFINETIKTGAPNLDHQFSFTPPTIESSFVKNYHDPEYEDSTKDFASNQLLNYNLISYPFKDKVDSVSRIGDLRTSFDPPDYLVNNSSSLESLMDQFQNRIANYSGSVEEVSLKQRHIYDLQRGRFNLVNSPRGFEQVLVNGPLIDKLHYPYYYTKTIPAVAPLLGPNMNQYFAVLDQYGKTKNILQSIKKDLSFSNRQFNMGEEVINAKIYNFINLITSTRILNLEEDTDELFLLPEEQTDYNNPARRFVEQVNTVRFLSEMRDLIKSRSRTIDKIYRGESSDSFFLCYKIEKYLDNDAGSPIQTYYTNDSEFVDTQLKYGRNYIYKTKALIGILGSSYSYSNLHISQNQSTMLNEEGVAAQSYPDGYNLIFAEKYRAYVDVEVTPSFQILEYQINEDIVAFVDTPTIPPQVAFHNNSKKANVEFFFSTMFSNIPTSQPSVEIQESEYEDILVKPSVALTEEDQRILNLLSNSKNDLVNPDYFTGIYEIYRMSTPPVRESDFANNFLTTVDDATSLIYPPSLQLPDIAIDNMNGYFQDFLIPNKKYYYAFRSLTYHGTPSNLTVPYEIELLRDSDEYKISVSQYHYPDQADYVYSKSAKRIVRVVPNIERLLFTTEEGIPAVNFQLDEGNLVPNSGVNKFKIRITSKHTGKKIDLNLNFLLEDRTNNQQN